LKDLPRREELTTEQTVQVEAQEAPLEQAGGDPPAPADQES
jgi:hypothetical protein